MKIINWSQTNESMRQSLYNRNLSGTQRDVTARVAKIIDEVKRRGDEALVDYTKAFDGIELSLLKVGSEGAQTDIRFAIDDAYARIRQFHALQMPQCIESQNNGVKAWKSWRPIDRVGLYIPGGTAPLLSTLLMLAIPAKLAGCQEIVCVTPPNQSGGVDPALRYAAARCGIEDVYVVGGAQAIAAMAYGTATIPKVDKIFGPGNKYVTEAKLQVSGDPQGAALDMPAGPSEVLVMADDQADPAVVASDLLAQAEHDVDARAICLTTNKVVAEAIYAAVMSQVRYLGRQAMIEQSLNNAAIIIADDLEQAFTIANRYAPEHLIINLNNARDYVPWVKNAGSVFLGPWSAEALGDYASGPNHVLPTYGYARNYSGLGVESFMKAITFQSVSKAGFLALAPTVVALADFEGLDAHKQSVLQRQALLEQTS